MTTSIPPLQLAHSVHDFWDAGGLRRPYVPIHLRPPDKDKTAHSSHRSRRIGKVLVVLWDGRKLFGVLRSYNQFGARESIPVLETIPLVAACLNRTEALNQTHGKSDKMAETATPQSSYRFTSRGSRGVCRCPTPPPRIPGFGDG